MAYLTNDEIIRIACTVIIDETLKWNISDMTFANFIFILGWICVRDGAV